MTLVPTSIVLVVVQCGQRICLARRSAQVGTARGLWSVVTGYLEPNTQPIDQALQEVSEELGLRPPAVALVRKLDPVPLTSSASGKQFLVYPFLFECSSAEDIVLNWEHDDVQWVDPSRLNSADCVEWQSGLVNALLDRTAVSSTGWEGSR